MFAKNILKTDLSLTLANLHLIRSASAYMKRISQYAMNNCQNQSNAKG